MADDLVNITIDGHQMAVPKGTLLVEAARQIGIEIPVYCYHPKMKPVGACRVCLVEVENQRRPMMPACTTTVMPDMVVHTRSDNAVEARGAVLEFLLINHPLDCPVCDRAGECDLQDFTQKYGNGNTRFIEQKRHFAKSKQVGKNVVLDRECCIMCQRCVRFCEEIAMEEGLVIVDRGNRSEIGTFEGRSFDSKFSGNVIELCPVGALTAKTYRFESRPWEQQHYAGICNVSSLGVNITVDVRYDEVVRLRGRMNDEIDDGWLSDKCRYSHLAIHSDDRILSPMVRNDQGQLTKVSWAAALERIVQAFPENASQIGLAVGTRLSVEDGHMLLRLGRALLKTPNVVHEHEAESLGTNTTLTGRVKGCDAADVILCLGSDPAKSHHDFELRIKKGLRNKARLICIGDQPALVGYADYQAIGVASELWSKLKKELKKETTEEESGLRFPKPRPWEAGGETSQDWDALVKEIRGAGNVLVVVSGDIARQGLQDVARDVEDLGWNTAPHGVIHLRSGVNPVGHESIGLIPEWDEDGNQALAKAWEGMNTDSGLSYAEMCRGKTEMLIAFGCNPLAQPESKKPKFLVQAATHPDETTEKADVVLPLSMWVEYNGVYISTDGTVQFNRQAILPLGEAQPAWSIARELCLRLGASDLPENPRAVYSEVGSLHAALAGATYKDFQTPGQYHWSYPQQADLGMPRPDLSAIPVKEPDMPMWMPAPLTGSTVEGAGRLHRGQTPPPVPGQRDPREIAKLLGLNHPMDRTAPPALTAGGAEKKDGYIPLRVVPSTSAEPAGPTPAGRHHEIGVGPRRRVAVPVAQTALLEASDAADNTTEDGGEE